METQLEFCKKFKRFNPLELSLSGVGFFLLVLCLLSSLFYLDLGSVNRAFRSRATATWLGGGSSAASDTGCAFAPSPPPETQKVQFPVQSEGADQNLECDFFDGKWVWDETYPLYNSRDCKFLDTGFRCSENGRPDDFYTKWRWQPNHCNLPRFDAKLMLEKLRDRRIVFVGDSIGRNQWESLLCMLASAVSNKSSIYEVDGNPITKHMGALRILFKDYNCSVEYYRSPYLVVQGRGPSGAPGYVKMTIRVDQMDWSSWQWKDADVLIFNSGHWWTNDKTIRTGCYFQEGDEVKANMSIQTAFQRSIETLLDWVDNQVNTNKTHIFFRSYAPVHFSAGDWKTGGSCHLHKLPNPSLTNTPKSWPEFGIVNRGLSRKPNTTKASKVQLLNVTYMTAQRKDGHSSVYYLGAKRASLYRQDCSHWCLPGVPDVWNELLYASLLLKLEPIFTNTSSKSSQT